MWSCMYQPVCIFYLSTICNLQIDKAYDAAVAGLPSGDVELQVCIIHNICTWIVFMVRTYVCVCIHQCLCCMMILLSYIYVYNYVIKCIARIRILMCTQHVHVCSLCGSAVLTNYILVECPTLWASGSEPAGIIRCLS